MQRGVENKPDQLADMLGERQADEDDSPEK